ncbi:Gfo/Idh/MocA family oxidoreductase [Candidatus Pseudothioglobus singularis]|nr:Gfo/Idh/MocA family oxidoreductase [Candidatus Pseudothioglobus singularis]
MKKNYFRVGIAGYGVVGKKRRVCIDSNSNLKVVAVCDQTFSSSGIMDDGVKYYSEYKQLIKNENLDILFVCMTNDILPEATIFALENNLHVFCEKPPGRTVDDIVNVRKIEAKYPDLKLMYGFNHRYHDSILDAMHILNSGNLGSVINLRAVYGKAKLITFNQDDWRTKRVRSGGGVLLDQGIHMVDLLRLFGGDYRTVYSIVSNDFWNFDVEDNAYALMKTDSGVVAMLHSSATSWKHTFRLEITTEKGGISLNGILSGSKSYGSETMTVTYANPDDDNGDPRDQTTSYKIDPSWDNEVTAFVKYIKEDKVVSSGSSLDALKTMELVFKIYASDTDWKNKYNI